MEKLTKNVFAKLFATFLGVAIVLVPVTAMVSCSQTKKHTVTQQEQKTKAR